MARKLTKKNKIVQKVVKKAEPVSKSTDVTIKKAQVNLPTGNFTEAVGRRKEATARVRIYEGKGDFIVNGQAAGQYFNGVRLATAAYLKPLELTGTKGKFAVTAQVSGSGISAQLGAVVHGLSRALIKYNPDFRVFLKPDGLLTRDDRMKESRKVGRGGKARRKRQSPRR